MRHRSFPAQFFCGKYTQRARSLCRLPSSWMPIQSGHECLLLRTSGHTTECLRPLLLPGLIRSSDPQQHKAKLLVMYQEPHEPVHVCHLWAGRDYGRRRSEHARSSIRTRCGHCLGCMRERVRPDDRSYRIWVVKAAPLVLIAMVCFVYWLYFGNILGSRMDNRIGYIYTYAYKSTYHHVFIIPSAVASG